MVHVCLTNMLYQNVFTTRYMQFLTLYASCMRAVSANFKEICGILVYSVEKSKLSIFYALEK